jgi:hypothetical protein
MLKARRVLTDFRYIRLGFFSDPQPALQLYEPRYRESVRIDQVMVIVYRNWRQFEVYHYL